MKQDNHISKNSCKSETTITITMANIIKNPIANSIVLSIKHVVIPFKSSEEAKYITQSQYSRIK